jgi:cytochrome c oxidase subunit 1
MMRAQLWLWFIGMIVTTFPWHWVGILGMPRRMAYFDFTSPALQPQAFSVTISTFGSLLLVLSGALFLLVLIQGQFGARIEAGLYRFSTAIHPPTRIPAALNGYALWLALMIGLTVTNYGFPIAQLALRSDTSVPAVYVGSQQ